MNYLSPVFKEHEGADINLLKNMDGRNGLSLFWIDIIRPLLEATGVRHILEIGADRGQNTRHLLAYIASVAGRLTVIEPFVKTELAGLLKGRDDISLLEMRSDEGLKKKIGRLEAVFLEGDLNADAAYNDLRAINECSVSSGGGFPVVFYRAGWPYGYRDMYYEPQAIEPGRRKDFGLDGLSPWLRSLEAGMINHGFANALLEGGENNGILAGVDRFQKEYNGELLRYELPYNHGLGIICRRESASAEYIENKLQISKCLRGFIETIEIARLNEILRRCREQAESAAIAPEGLLTRIVRAFNK